ncbi:hypothetical protein ACP0GO_23145, partial [Escherichia coli]
MQINKVMSLLDILTSWLEDNINMESDLFFDNDVDNTTSEGTVAKLAMRQPFVLFKGLTFQKLCL